MSGKHGNTLRKPITGSQALTSAALSATTSIGRRFKLEQVMVQASVAITETITVTLDSAQGSSYDVILKRESLVAAQSFVYRPQGELNCNAGDEIKVQCTNANTTGTVYYEIRTSEILQ